MSSNVSSGSSSPASQPVDFDALGIQFKVVTKDMIPDCLDFLWEQFAPQATLMRNLNITRNWVMDEIKFKECFKEETSIAAIDKDGKIIGMRLGKIVRRKDWSGWAKDKVVKKMLPYLVWFLPTGMRNLPVYSKIFKLLNFDIWQMFEKFSCDTIYAANGLCSIRASGVRGLGTELVKRSEVLAREKGCQVVAAIVTGIYSERVFKNLDYIQLSELIYDDFRDKNGERYLKDTREHIKCLTCWKDLRQPEQPKNLIVSLAPQPVVSVSDVSLVLKSVEDGVNPLVPDLNLVTKQMEELGQDGLIAAPA